MRSGNREAPREDDAGNPVGEGSASIGDASNYTSRQGGRPMESGLYQQVLHIRPKTPSPVSVAFKSGNLEKLYLLRD